MRVIVVGGGFGGIRTARELAKDHGIDVTLISDKDHFVYYPALYAVATGGTRRQSFIPLHDVFRGTRVKVVHDTIIGYDPARRMVRGEHGDYSYQRLVFAIGVVTSYFGIRGLDNYSFGIKSHDEVVALRRHLHDELTGERKIDKQYVIVGAGPTGVELAASLASYIRHIADAHAIRHSRIKIKLVEAAPRVLPRMSEFASSIVRERLQSLDVDVMTGETVEWQDDDEVFVSGRSLPTHTVIWTAGVTNHPFFAQHARHFELAPSGRVIVNEHLMAGEHTYVIGDNASTQFSGLAQTALRDADYVSRDIIRDTYHRLRPAYTPARPAVVVPVGTRWAIMEWRALCVSGYLGHIMRRMADLIGYHDIAPFRLALAIWRSHETREDSCPTCRSLQ